MGCHTTTVSLPIAVIRNDPLYIDPEAKSVCFWVDYISANGWVDGYAESTIAIKVIPNGKEYPDFWALSGWDRIQALQWMQYHMPVVFAKVCPLGCIRVVIEWDD